MPEHSAVTDFCFDVFSQQEVTLCHSPQAEGDTFATEDARNRPRFAFGVKYSHCQQT